MKKSLYFYLSSPLKINAWKMEIAEKLLKIQVKIIELTISELDEMMEILVDQSTKQGFLHFCCFCDSTNLEIITFEKFCSSLFLL